MFVDMDDFKTVNDSLGHDAGDQVLTTVAARLQLYLREGDSVARLGGERPGGTGALATPPTRADRTLDCIPLAEESGLIIPIGRWILATACRQAHEWHQRYPRLPALEITESTLLDRSEVGQDRLRALRALGLRLAIDDFGTGYSSLSYLRELPVDILKIDKSFIDGLVHDGEALAVASTIIELGRTLRLDTVAEGHRGAAAGGAAVAAGLPAGAGLPVRTAAGPCRRRGVPGCGRPRAAGHQRKPGLTLRVASWGTAASRRVSAAARLRAPPDRWRTATRRTAHRRGRAPPRRR